MRRKVLFTLLASLGLLFFLLPAAQAQTAWLYFNGKTSGGDSVPYQIILNGSGGNHSIGTPVWLNCDDHVDLISGGEYWNAYVIQGSDDADLLKTRMSLLNPTWSQSDAEKAYDEKAYIELTYGPSSNPAYSDAIWHIFDSNFTCDTACQTILTAAQLAVIGDGTLTHPGDGGSNDYDSYRQHLTIYTPCFGASNCNDGQNGSSGTTPLPQEFDGVPDGGLTVMLLGGALVGLEALRRRLRV